MQWGKCAGYSYSHVNVYSCAQEAEADTEQVRAGVPVALSFLGRSPLVLTDTISHCAGG